MTGHVPARWKTAGWRAGGPQAALLLCLAGAAQAQSTQPKQPVQPGVNSGALDALKPTPARPRPAPQHRPAQPAARPNAAKPTPAALPVPPKPPSRPPAVPTVPPAIAAIPPAVFVPVQRPPDQPPVVVAADAPGEASPAPGGVRVTFGTGRADLNAATDAAIRSFVRPLRDSEQPINVLAYAAGSADDPSTPRRLSLARALAARAVLINEGVASTRIYVRALGSAGGDGPADRVDLSANAPGAPSAPASAAKP